MSVTYVILSAHAALVRAVAFRYAVLAQVLLCLLHAVKLLLRLACPAVLSVPVLPR